MPPALIVALVFTVILLVITAYFLMGSMPLLILKHDTPLDARFVRGFFNTYYVAATYAAGATALSYAAAGKHVFAAGATALAVLTIFLRRKVMQRMDALRAELRPDSAGAIAAFRRTHLAAIAANLAQLAVIVWSLVALPL
ncbi:MAG TPA: hypothetical protein VLD35_01055 [Caldimonas sp.]|nr:hypothetical protein [Caldimonas sp.]